MKCSFSHHFRDKIIACHIQFLFLWCYLKLSFTASLSCVEKDAREKLAPYSSLSSEESYRSRDLEKVNLDAAPVSHAYIVFGSLYLLLSY